MTREFRPAESPPPSNPRAVLAIVIAGWCMFGGAVVAWALGHMGIAVFLGVLTGIAARAVLEMTRGASAA